MRKVLNILIIVSLITTFNFCESHDDSVITDLEISNQNVTLSKNSAVTVTIHSGNGGYTATSSDVTVAKAVVINDMITITGMDEGAATVILKDRQNKTVSITVIVKIVYKIPTSPIFLWNGEEKELDQIWGGYSTTILKNSIGITDIFTDKKQYLLSWTGDMTEGDKTDATLRIVGEEYEAEEISLSALRIVQAEAYGYYIVFREEQREGELFFVK